VQVSKCVAQSVPRASRPPSSSRPAGLPRAGGTPAVHLLTCTHGGASLVLQLDLDGMPVAHEPRFVFDFIPPKSGKGARPSLQAWFFPLFNSALCAYNLG